MLDLFELVDEIDVRRGISWNTSDCSVPIEENDGRFQGEIEESSLDCLFSFCSLAAGRLSAFCSLTAGRFRAFSADVTAVLVVLAEVVSGFDLP